LRKGKNPEAHKRWGCPFGQKNDGSTGRGSGESGEERGDRREKQKVGGGRERKLKG